MEKQSHAFTKETMQYIKFIKEAAKQYEITIKDLLSNSREWRVVAARRVLCALLLEEGLSFKDIGKVINRDRKSVVMLMTRKRTRTLAHLSHKMHDNPAAREDGKLEEAKMYEAGSKALLRAIFAADRIYSPMTAEEIEAAKDWANSGRCHIEPTGWLS